MTLRYQILALAIIPLIVAILTVTAFITWQSSSLIQTSIATFERNMLKAKETELLNLTNLALSAIQDIYDKAGPDDDAAKEQVRAILTSLDYGRDGYFFVYDYQGNNIVHPRQKFRPGKNWLNLVDPTGNPVIASLIEKAKEGGGIHQYKWEKPSTGQMADKSSFAVGLDKWGWMLGTGVYLDDVYAQTAAARADFRTNIGKTFLIVSLIAVPAVMLVFATSMLLTLRERRLADEKLKALAQRIIDTQEEERARLARELHDGISQNLVGVHYALDLANRQALAGNQEAPLAIARASDALNGAIKEVRRLSHDLRPRILDDLGLHVALKALCEHFSERTGVNLHFEAEDSVRLISPEASTALYRVAQEALTNIERHADATWVSLSLFNKRGRITMIIADNGKGFKNSDSVAALPGLGLRNMQERVAHFGGVLMVESSENGTRLTAKLPKSNLRPQSAAVAQVA